MTEARKVSINEAMEEIERLFNRADLTGFYGRFNFEGGESVIVGLGSGSDAPEIQAVDDEAEEIAAEAAAEMEN